MEQASASKKCKFCGYVHKTVEQARECEKEGPATNHKYKVHTMFYGKHDTPIFIIEHRTTRQKFGKKISHGPAYLLSDNRVYTEWDIDTKIYCRLWRLAKR